MMLPVRGMVLALAFTALATIASRAQTVSGKLLESGTGEPITLGTVALLDTTLVLVMQVFTDHAGRFELEAPRPGAYYVLANRIGYHGAVDGILDLDEGGRIEVTFYLRPEPVLLDSLVVSVQRQRSRRFLEGQGFYERERLGFGRFITPEDIERKMPLQVQDLLQGIPNVLVGSEVRGLTFSVRCGTAAVYVDGIRVPAAAVHVNDIAAIEIYHGPASTPLQFSSMGADACGAVLIWTKH